MPTKTKPRPVPAPHSTEQRIPQPSPGLENAGDKKLVNFRLEPAVIYELKLLALQEGKPLQALICEGLNEVFAKRNLPQIAK
jgi:hypothetical protein